MKLTTVLWLAIALLGLTQRDLLAQNAPIDFENGGHGADWTWAVFENSTNPPLTIMANPDPSGANTSAQVAAFTALQAGQPWAGCESQHGNDIGTFSLNSSNCTVSIMVYKTEISNVGIKFATPAGAADVELLVANTLVNQWEELVFDFSGRLDSPNSVNIDQIIVFPDYNLSGRQQDNVVYFDNITFSAQLIVPGPQTPAPAPTFPAANVIALFSDEYTDVTVDTWSAVWDLADVTTVQIDGDNVKKYTSMVYAGIEFTSSTIDATEMTHFHMDFWTADPVAGATFNIKLVDFGANGVWDGGGDDVEYELSFTSSTTPALVSGEWISFDLPLDLFTGLVTRGHLAQIVIGGDPNTVYIDNVLFHAGTVAVEPQPERPAAFTLAQNHPNPFNPGTSIAFELNRAGSVSLTIHDITGRFVTSLADGALAAGTHRREWNGLDARGEAVASGVYICTLSVADQGQQSRRMLLLK